MIAGGGAGALATARAYRDAGGDGDVTLVTPEATIPYTRPARSTHGRIESGAPLP